MSDSPFTLDFIGRTMLAIQAEMRDIRQENRDMRSLLLATVDQVRRVDRHVIELKDELELIVKTEIMGRIGIFEGGVEKQVSELRDRVEELETGKSRFTP